MVVFKYMWAIESIRVVGTGSGCVGERGISGLIWGDWCCGCEIALRDDGRSVSWGY